MKIYQPSVTHTGLESSELGEDTLHKVDSSPQLGKGGMHGSNVSVGSGEGHKVTEDSRQSGGYLYNFFSYLYSYVAPAPEESDESTTVEESHGGEDRGHTGVVSEKPGGMHKESVSIDDEDSEVVFSHDDDNEIDDDDQFFTPDDNIDDVIFTQSHKKTDFLNVSSTDVEIEESPLEDLIGPSDLDEVVESHIEDIPREEVQKEVEQQQGYFGAFFSGALKVGGWVAGTAVNVAVKTVQTTVNTVHSVYTYVTDSPESTKTKESEKKLTLQEQNIAKLGKLSTQIDDKLLKLNEQLRIMGAEQLQQPESQRLDKPKLTMWDTLTRWNHQARGAFSATVSTIGWGAVGAGVATGGSLVPHLGVQATAILSGAYLGLSALKDFPSLAHNQGAISLVEATLKDVDKDFAELERLQVQEKSRQQGMTRTMLVSLERQEHVDMLKTELDEVSRAMETAPSSLDKLIPTRHELTVSDGTQRQETLTGVAKAKQAFQSFFSAIGSGLASIGRFIADLPNVPGRFMERRAAGKAELAYTQGEGKTVLSTLSVPKENSLVSTGKGTDVHAMRRSVEAGGTTQSVREVRHQIVTGENLSRAILSSKDGTFGAVVVGDEGGKLPVTANLTTARSLAWYLDTLSQTPDHEDPNAPQVKRSEDGSLTISDPEGKLYGFLMHAPTAYTSSMRTEEGQSSTPGGLRLDDHHNGFPQGGRGMQFERTLDENGKFVLRMSFPKEEGRPPVFKPLGTENQALMRMYEAMHTTGQSLGGSTDYSSWTLEQLETRQNFLMDELQRQTKLMSGDQEQVSQLENWQNPAFLTGRA